jgi:hypothetical protein
MNIVGQVPVPEQTNDLAPKRNQVVIFSIVVISGSHAGSVLKPDPDT